MRNIVFCFSFIFSTLSWGQVDSLSYGSEGVQLPLVNVTETAVSKSSLLKAPTPRGLSEILNQSSMLSMKNYGSGSLATFSQRGHSTSQTAITLDGFSIQSHMNGVYDLSLIPSFFLQDITISGGASSAEIQGSIGGALKLNTRIPPATPTHLECIASYGSFDTWGLHLGGVKKWTKHATSSLKLFWRQSDNDFKYRNLNVIGKPLVRMPNAAYRQFGVQQNNRFFFLANNTIETKLWYVNNNRQIPPTQSTADNGAFQDDALLNVILSWKKYWNEKLTTTVSKRYGFEFIAYNSPSVTSRSKAHKWENRIQTTYKLAEAHSFTSYLGYEYNTAFTGNYEVNRPETHRAYTQLQYRFQQPNFQAEVSLKEDYSRGQFSPFLFGMNAKYRWKWTSSQSLKIMLGASKNYRRPTFNDLYWNETSGAKGNPNLLPEEGWKEELKFVYHINEQYQVSVLGFNSNIRQWILWYPNDEGKWTPENIRKVWSRGLEVGAKASFVPFKNTKCILSGNYHFTKTTNQTGSENTIGKQLIYVPLHRADGAIEWRYKKWYLHFNMVLNSKRFHTADNADFVPSYAVGNIMLGRYFSWNKIKLEPTLEIRNIWNEEYQVMASRPMPFRHFQMTIYATMQ